MDQQHHAKITVALMEISVITNCTNRKRVPPPDQLCARTLLAGSSVEVATHWASRLLQCETGKPAHEIYCGRSFSEARGASHLLGGQLLIASAGLGLIHADALIPSYSVTVSSGSEDSILRRTGGSAVEWWNALVLRSPFSVKVTPQRADLILVALSRPYFNLLLETFIKWTDADLEKLRLFVRILPDELPRKLQASLMPYGARFDHPLGPRPGTQADFAQRALRHFVEHVLPHSFDNNTDQHANMVNECLSHLTPPDRPNRTRATDAEVKRLIQTHWHTVDGSSSHMLRFLRRHLGIACEQSRFRVLFHEVRASTAHYTSIAENGIHE
jgi:hypothetical protein